MSAIPINLNPFHPDFDPNDGLWQVLPEEAKLALWRAAEDELIAEHGYSCVGVFPTAEDDLEYHFAYTVGEPVSIIVTGVSAAGAALLGLARNHLPADGIGVPFEVGDDGYSAVFAPVPDDQFRDHCTSAVARGAERAVQFIWQDDQGRWPWDPGHAHQEAGGAPVLAGDDWRPV